MPIDVEIFSKEMIKPSSPTPTHLKTLQLSFLDQTSSSIHVPLIFFYHHHLSSQLLKQSLSKILTIFYPLAGRIQGISFVDCDDSGAEFVEARARTRLSELLQHPDVEQLKKLHPVVEDETVVLKVQTNIFDCGGIAVGVCLSHRVADGTAQVAFVNAWAATCRGETETKISNPNFGFASFFPPKPLSDFEFVTQEMSNPKEKIVTKRFVLDKEKLAKMKDFSTSSKVNPTRIEAVSSYIWRQMMEAIKARAAPPTSYVAAHVVNLRPRKHPPVSEHMFGNCWTKAHAMVKPEVNYFDIVAKLRASIRSIDDDFIKQVENGEYLNHLKRSYDLYVKNGVESCHFSSWCRFPVYEVDFGSGKPDWVCTTTVPYRNVVILMSTANGEGIEAWVNMLQDDMEMFQTHFHIN